MKCKLFLNIVWENLSLLLTTGRESYKRCVEYSLIKSVNDYSLLKCDACSLVDRS
jgi:hypothetical protein